MTDVDVFLQTVTAAAVTPVFQPIVDLFKGTVVAYEVLSRGPEPFASPLTLFTRARAIGRTWELEAACRAAAIARIREFRDRTDTQWFLNVSPEVFSDPRFRSGAAVEEITASGIDPKSVVLEITERYSINDTRAFQDSIRYYSEHGFHIALDDFGSGNSGLVTLIACVPHVIKLDMELTRDVNHHPYKQTIIQSIVSLAASVNARLVAEGVESWQELEMLVRQGVRYVQGRLLGWPAAIPEPLPPDVQHEILDMISGCRPTQSNVNEDIARLATQSPAIETGSMTVEELDRLFARSGIDCAVLVEHGAAVGLITRAQLAAATSGRFGYALMQKKPIGSIAKLRPLVVPKNVSVVRLATLAMERIGDDLYDPVVITDERGRYFGTVAMKQLILRAAELELESARESNPLTGLPGNPRIQAWIVEALQTGGTVIYADLDHFKEFNDAFGFIAGDDMIRLVANVLRHHLPLLGRDARLGHLGGDDYVIVAPAAVADVVLHSICEAFDAEKRDMFSPAALERGSFDTLDRRGNRIVVPLTTLSLAVIPSEKLGCGAHSALLSQAAASLKRRAKQASENRRSSSYAIEQRAHAAAAPVCADFRGEESGERCGPSQAG